MIIMCCTPLGEVAPPQVRQVFWADGSGQRLQLSTLSVVWGVHSQIHFAFAFTFDFCFGFGFGFGFSFSFGFGFPLSLCCLRCIWPLACILTPACVTNSRWLPNNIQMSQLSQLSPISRRSSWPQVLCHLKRQDSIQDTRQDKQVQQLHCNN